MRIWPFKKKRKADAKEAASHRKIPEPLADPNFGEKGEIEDKIRSIEESKEPATKGDLFKHSNGLVQAVTDTVEELRSEWTGIQKSLKEGIKENHEKISAEFDKFQEKTMDLLNNLASYFEDKQKQDSASQLKEREAMRAEVELRIKELAEKGKEVAESLDNRGKEVADSIDNRSKELSDSIDKRFSELEAKINSELGELSKKALAGERRLQQQSAAIDAQRKRVDDLMEVMGKFIEDNKENIQASKNIRRMYLALLDLIKEIMESKGVPYKITEAYVSKKIDETVENNLKEIEFMINKAKMEQETIERIRFETDAKDKMTSH